MGATLDMTSLSFWIFWECGSPAQVHLNRSAFPKKTTSFDLSFF